MISGTIGAGNKGDMDPFPYEYRGDQHELVNLIRDSVLRGGHLVIESGTGTGKTISALSGVIEALADTGGKIVYLTRTKSQQRQVIREVAEISKRLETSCIGFQGRSEITCPMMCGDSSLMAGTSEELSKLCSEYKKCDQDGHFGCKYFENSLDVDVSKYVRMLSREHFQPEEFFNLLLEDGVCPYEMSKKLLPYVDVIAVPYPFLFSPNTVNSFLGWLGSSLSDIVVIVDEAHNLPPYLRDTMTYGYSMKASELAEAEAIAWGNPKVHNDMKVTDVISFFRDCMNYALSEYLDGDDGILPYGFLREGMMERMHVSSVILVAIYKDILEHGEIVAADKKSKKILPRSYMRSFGLFLMSWDAFEEETSINLIQGGENPGFESFCLDPYEAAYPLRGCHASISMSGTLQPLSDYSRELGLDSAIERVFPSPFPEENLEVFYVDDVSTGYVDITSSKETYTRILGYIDNIVNCVSKNTVIFFPSYSLMDRALNDGLVNMLGRTAYIERRGMSQSDLMETVSDFRSDRGSVLLSVMGGRISEGLDFPDEDLELAILVGLPFPKPTAKQEALRRYCDYRFGDGWEHAVKIPTQRKIRQAVGRLIRSDTDRGVAIILDRRAPMVGGMDMKLTNDPVCEVMTFFDSTRQLYKSGSFGENHD